MRLLSICTVLLLVLAAQEYSLAADGPSDQRRGDARVGSSPAPLNPLEALLKVREVARRTQSFNNLKQLALAMHNYQAMRNEFPAPASYDKQGKPLLSWRVHLLPFLEGEALYKKFKLDEPWDSPHNKKLIAEMPAVFKSPGSKLKDPGLTNYVLPVGKDAAFHGEKGVKPASIKDGLSNTLMILEVADSHAVVWTKPEDLNYDPKKPLAGLDGPFTAGFLAAFFDGSVREIQRDIDEKLLRALFTPAGGERIGE